jgi:ankyrin repeat protein
VSWTPPNPKYPPPKAGEPRLHRAARVGDHGQIRAFVSEGDDVNELFEINLDPGARAEPATPLMVAAGSGLMVAAGSGEGASATTLQLLLELGAEVAPGDGLSPLPYASIGLGWNYPPGGDAERVAVLLAAGADPQATAKNGASALACAGRSGDPERVRLLLGAGADPMPPCVEDRGGQPWLFGFRDPLFMACESGSAECVRLLLGAGVDLQRYPDNEESPLAAATSLDVVRVLLDAGANPLHDEGGRRSVVESVAGNDRMPVDERIEMLRALHSAGADLDALVSGVPALFGAGLSFDDEAVEVLLRAGADPFVEPTALMGVCFSFSDAPDPRVDRIIDLLVAAGLDPNGPDEAGLRPLHAAMSPDQYGPGYAESDGFNEAATLALLRVGAAIDITYPDTGFTPLHAAAAAGQSER